MSAALRLRGNLQLVLLMHQLVVQLFHLIQLKMFLKLSLHKMNNFSLLFPLLLLSHYLIQRMSLFLLQV
ncbi:hypothetical protein Patl1_02029 [Pistacia atlantica]|uniref:Uncharacterized protein n=1 Tax=Pistacia atlantica TaxID=434234 RepID=A0ACC1C7C9_9ROSI|nr:hypothetical protein Patl1_02029 [Pistacia atlantica]